MSKSDTTEEFHTPPSSPKWEESTKFTNIDDELAKARRELAEINLELDALSKKRALISLRENALSSRKKAALKRAIRKNRVDDNNSDNNNNNSNNNSNNNMSFAIVGNSNAPSPIITVKPSNKKNRNNNKPRITNNIRTLPAKISEQPFSQQLPISNGLNNIGYSSTFVNSLLLPSGEQLNTKLEQVPITQINGIFKKDQVYHDSMNKKDQIYTVKPTKNKILSNKGKSPMLPPSFSIPKIDPATAHINHLEQPTSTPLSKMKRASPPSFPTSSTPLSKMQKTVSPSPSLSPSVNSHFTMNNNGQNANTHDTIEKKVRKEIKEIEIMNHLTKLIL
ncbi:unnamed protein product [Cunninghamella blakesleeana]